MVLSSRRRGRAALLVALAAATAALAGCNQSLFDNHNGVGGGGSDAGTDGTTVPTSCPDVCLGDAAANFNDRAGAMAARWRYLEDQGRSWQAMTDGGSTMTGQHPGNQITSCKENPAPACVELPGALLMSSGANDPVVDPAIEFALPPEMPPQVIQLSLRAYLASGDDQMIRLYRNSREDLLFSETLTAMRHVDYAIVVDALPNDRFLVAISGDKAADKVALHLYVNTPADKTFPVSCQLALPFNPPMASSTPDLCSKHTFSATPAPVMLGDAPFMEQGSGALLALGGYLQRDGTGPGYTLDWSHDVTVQLWAQPTMLTTVPSYLFSDLDPDPGACGGVELWVYGTNGTPYINLTGCTNPQSAEVGGIMTAPRFPMDNGWHFVRVVRSAAGFDLCVDGLHTASLQVQAGAIVSHNPPTLGNQSSVSGSAHFVGGLDDVRVFTGALPCK